MSARTRETSVIEQSKPVKKRTCRGFQPKMIRASSNRATWMEWPGSNRATSGLVFMMPVQAQSLHRVAW
jgi:hypothetical protein